MQTATKLKPFQLVTMATPNSVRRRVVETACHPYATAGSVNNLDRIHVRVVPGDPTTLREVAVEDLIPAGFGKRTYCHIAEVRSGFTFPDDMLRYDGAALYDPDLHEAGEVDERWPDTRMGLKISEATDTDLTVMATTESPGIPYTRQPRILVYATTDRKAPPWTVARWNSFSCSIKHLHTKKLGD